MWVLDQVVNRSVRQDLRLEQRELWSGRRNYGLLNYFWFSASFAGFLLVVPGLVVAIGLSALGDSLLGAPSSIAQWAGDVVFCLPFVLAVYSFVASKIYFDGTLLYSPRSMQWLHDVAITALAVGVAGLLFHV